MPKAPKNLSGALAEAWTIPSTAGRVTTMPCPRFPRQAFTCREAAGRARSPYPQLPTTASAGTGNAAPRSGRRFRHLMSQSRRSCIGAEPDSGAGTKNRNDIRRTQNCDRPEVTIGLGSSAEFSFTGPVRSSIARTPSAGNPLSRRADAHRAAS